MAVQQPDSDNYSDGSRAVSMIFNPVMKNSLQYLHIEPTNKEEITKVTNPNVEGLTVEESKQLLSEQGLEAIVIGNGPKVLSQLPNKDEILIPGEKVIIKTEGDLIAPDMTGWSLRDVMKVAKVANMKLNSVGNGFVVKQNYKSGSKMQEGEYLIVDLDRPIVNPEDNVENGTDEDQKSGEDNGETTNPETGMEQTVDEESDELEMTD